MKQKKLNVEIDKIIDYEKLNTVLDKEVAKDDNRPCDMEYEFVEIDEGKVKIVAKYNLLD